MERTEHILIVDDEPDVRDALARVIRRGRPGARILTASNGYEALSLIGAQPVDLIVSDQRMPGMAGLEFLERAYKIAPDVPRIMMTAFAETDLVVNGANRAHLTRFVAKPFRVDETLRTIGALLDERHERRAREAAMARALEAAEALKARTRTP